jgi:hypothetical protein
LISSISGIGKTKTPTFFDFSPNCGKLLISFYNKPPILRRVRMLSRYADVIPTELLYRYVNCLTHIYVGYTGSSLQFSRTDFYADGASMYIPQLFEKFDGQAADAFLNSIRENQTLRRWSVDFTPLGRHC